MYASRGLEIAGVFTNGALLLPCPWRFVDDASLLRSKYLSHFLFLVSCTVSAPGIPYGLVRLLLRRHLDSENLES
jgi:hypothetical protein